MREHVGLFRGKRIDNGEWVDGYFAGFGLICPNEPEDTYNATGDYCGQTPYVGFVEVDPDTVGACAGLRDKNGKLIFEGDLCLCDRHINDRIDRKVYEIKCEPARGFFGENFCEISADEFCMAEVVGIIYDNPELLKGERND